MKFYKIVMITLMTWVFVFGPQVIAQETFGSENLVKVVHSFNSKSLDFESVILILNKKESFKAKDFEKYIENQTFSKKYKLPKLNVKNDRIVFDVQGELVSIKISEQGDVELFYKNKSSIIKTNSSFEDIKAIVEKMTKSEKQFSMINILINDAYSDDLMTRVYNESSMGMVIGMSIIIAVIGALFVLESPIIALNLKMNLKSLDEVCEKLNGKVIGANEEKIIQDTIDKIKIYEDKCKFNLIQMDCQLEIKKIKSCLEGLKFSLSKVNNSNRNEIKEKLKTDKNTPMPQVDSVQK